MKKILLSLLSIVSVNAYADSDTLKYSINAGINLSDGNVKVHSFSLGGELKGISRKRDWSISPSYQYLETFSYPVTPTSKTVRQNEFYVSSSLSYFLGNNFKILIFSEEEHSEIRKIQWRANLGVGTAYKLIKSPTTEFHISGVILPDYYLSVQTSGSPYKKDNLSLRVSVRAKFTWKKDPVTINSIQIFQPSLRTWTDKPDEYVPWPDNFNFRSVNNMEVKVTGRISTGIQLNLVYQSYLGYIAKQPDFMAKGLYLSPYDYTFVFFIKYKKD